MPKNELCLTNEKTKRGMVGEEKVKGDEGIGEMGQTNRVTLIK